MNSFLRSLALTLALSAMLARALLPVGWMPVAGGGALVICGAAGTTHQTQVPAHDHTTPRGGMQLCPYAAAAHLAAPEPVFHAVLVRASARDIRVPATRDFAGHPPYRTQSPRAPPGLA
ncbi:MAG TPA: DUF2946 family protein [Rhizomicrobium sp.]